KKRSSVSREASATSRLTQGRYRPANISTGREPMSRQLSRRQFVAATAAASAGFVTAPYVRSAYAAGKLSMGFWDHWVPGANNTLTALVNEWADKERVEVQIDYITSQGQKLLVTTSAEAQAQSGHDILAMAAWQPHAYAD